MHLLGDDGDEVFLEVQIDKQRFVGVFIELDETDEVGIVVGDRVVGEDEVSPVAADIDLDAVRTLVECGTDRRSNVSPVAEKKLTSGLTALDAGARRRREILQGDLSRVPARE